MNTRAANANAHPGEHHTKYSTTRRPTAVVQAERDAAQAEKKAKALSLKAAAEKVVQLENDARQKEKNLYTNTPIPFAASISRQTRPKPKVLPEATGPKTQAETIEADKPGQKVRRRKTKRVQKIVYEEIEVDDDDDDQLEAEQADVDAANNTSPDSEMLVDERESLAGDSIDSEFEPKDDDEDDDDEVEEIMELGEEESDEKLVVKGKGKKTKVKKGVVLRESIRVIHDAGETLPNEALKKRKAASEAQLSTSKRTKKELRGDKLQTGVVRGWDKNLELLPPPTPTPASTRSGSVSSRSSVPPSRAASRASNLSAADGGDDDDAPAFNFGGVGESAGASFDQSVAITPISAGKDGKANRFRSIVKTEALDGGPSIIRREPSGRKARPKHGDLPDEAKSQLPWMKVVAYDIMSGAAAWNELSDDQICQIWSTFVADYDISPNGPANDDSVQIFGLFKKIINSSVSMWIHKFASAAEDALNKEFDHRQLSTFAARGAFVKAILGNAKQDSKNHPFLWKTTDDLDWPGDGAINPQFQGLFLGRLVLKTLSSHYKQIGDVEMDATVHSFCTKPRGALILAVQAVHRALLYSMNGTFSLPSDRASSMFSKSNWGDIPLPISIGANGRQISNVERRATVYDTRLDKMTDQHWKMIIEGAKDGMKRKKGKGQSQNNQDDVDVVYKATEEDDDILHDPMFDNPSVAE